MGEFPEVSEFTATSHCSRNVVHSCPSLWKDIRAVLRLIMPTEFTLPRVIMEAEGTSIYLQQMRSIRKENGMNVHGVTNSEVYNNLKMILFHKNILVRNLKTYLFSMLKILDLSLKGGTPSRVSDRGVQSVQLLSRVSLRPHESQHARPPCPSPTPGVHSDSRPSSQ